MYIYFNLNHDPPKRRFLISGIKYHDITKIEYVLPGGYGVHPLNLDLKPGEFIITGDGSHIFDEFYGKTWEQMSTKERYEYYSQENEGKNATYRKGGKTRESVAYQKWSNKFKPIQLPIVPIIPINEVNIPKNTTVDEKGRLINEETGDPVYINKTESLKHDRNNDAVG